MHANLEAIAWRGEKPYIWIMRFRDKPPADFYDPYIGSAVVTADVAGRATVQGFTMSPKGWTLWRFVRWWSGLDRQRANFTKAEMRAALSALAETDCAEMFYERWNTGEARPKPIPIRRNVVS